MKRINFFAVVALFAAGTTFAANQNTAQDYDCYTNESDVHGPGLPDARQSDCNDVPEEPCCYIANGQGTTLLWRSFE